MLKTGWNFFQNEVVGMAWLNRLIGNLINAKKYFKKLLLLNPNLKFVNIYLKNINDRLAHKKTPILPISVIEDPDCYTNSLHYTTKGRITNIISKFKQGLILKK